MRRIAVSLSVLMMAALGAPATALAATAAPTAPAHVAAAAPAGGIETMSCLGAKSCIGLGVYTSPVKGESAFLRTWNGAAWGPIYGALPASADDAFSSISCTSAKFCVAVGGRFASNGVFPVLATWNGSAWKQTAPPAPASSIKNTDLTSVSCANARSCVAIGEYNVTPSNPAYNDGQLPEGFIDLWNGTKWAASYKTTSGRKGIQATELNGISCRSATNCVAVGTTYEPIFTLQELTDNSYHPVALTWNGRKWAASTAPIPSSGHGILGGVSCWSVSRCLAVGYYYGPGQLGYPNIGKTTLIAERWNGAKWSVAKLPTPGRAPWLNSVSCLSTSSCVAVGAVNGASSIVDRSIADVWNGKTWRAAAVATPKGGAGSTHGYPNGFVLSDVTCAAVKDCVAFGWAGPLQDPVALTPFAELYAGSRLSNIADS